MATIKVSNEEVISRTKKAVRFIQRERHKCEQAAIEEINALFSVYTFKSVFKRDFKLWVYLGPLIIFPILFYPVSLLFKYAEWKSKPPTENIYEKAQWLDKIQDDWYCTFTCPLDSGEYEEQHEAILNLRCMAEHNEDDYMMISREEAEYLGIC